MPSISMIDVTNFILKSGEPRMTHVRMLKNRSVNGYDPQTDFYKRLRDGIIAYNKPPVGPKSELDRIAIGLSDPKKIAPFKKSVQGYKKFLGKKTISPFTSVKDKWDRGDMQVRVNPELGLDIDGVRHVVKLYPNKEHLDRKRADMMLVMMKDALVELDADVQVAVLDIQRGKLYTKPHPKMSLLPLLEAEVAAISVLWRSV